MPKQTQKTNQSYNNAIQYGQIHPESNKYIDAFANFQPQTDPTIGFRAAGAKRSLQRTLDNPTGGFRTAAMRDALMTQGQREIDTQAGQETRAGNYDVNNQRMGQLGSLASLMAPRVAQMGSTGTSSSNTETGKNVWGNVLDIGMGAASMALM